MDWTFAAQPDEAESCDTFSLDTFDTYSFGPDDPFAALGHPVLWDWLDTTVGSLPIAPTPSFVEPVQVHDATKHEPQPTCVGSWSLGQVQKDGRMICPWVRRGSSLVYSEN